jgi:hypothetical protein
MFEFVKTRNEKEIKNEISRTIAGEFDFANKMYLAYSILKSRYPNVYKCDLTDFMDLYKNLISIANSYELETGEKIDKNIQPIGESSVVAEQILAPTYEESIENIKEYVEIHRNSVIQSMERIAYLTDDVNFNEFDIMLLESNKMFYDYITSHIIDNKKNNNSR